MLPLEKDSNPYQHAKLDYHATVRELPSHELCWLLGSSVLEIGVFSRI